MRSRAATAFSLAALAAFAAGFIAARQTEHPALARASGIELGSQTHYLNVHFRQFGFTAPQASCSVLMGSSSQAYAEISLPDGVTLTNIRFEGSNNNNKVNTNTCFLERLDIATCTASVVGSVAMNESFSGSFRESALNHVVDNATSHYRLRLLVPSAGSLTIKRVRIGYTAQGGAAAMCPGDNNADNLVNGADLSVLLSNFGGSCS